MLYRRLGSTGLEISEIAFGAWGIGRGFWKGGDDSEAARALEAAADGGINFFDTALGYGGGHSERLIGALLRRHRGRLHVATKIPPLNRRWPAAGPIEEAFSRSHIEACVEESRRNLGVDTIDLVQLHVWRNEWTADRGWSDMLEELRHRGWLRSVGVSGTDHDPQSLIPLVEQERVDTVQVIYNIFDQQPADELFGLCAERDVGVLVRVPLDEGGLSGALDRTSRFPRGDWRNRYFTPPRLAELTERVGRLGRLLGEEAVTLPELALRFCLAPGAVSTVLVGMRTQNHVRANAAVSDARRLSAEMLEELAAHGWRRNFYVPD